MMANPMLDQALDVATALGAIKIKGARLVSGPGGVELRRPGWPALLLTYEAARKFAAEVAEAEHG